jgi:hypothetical protein
LMILWKTGKDTSRVSRQGSSARESHSPSASSFLFFVWIHFPPSLDQSRPIVVQLFSLFSNGSTIDPLCLFFSLLQIQYPVSCAVLCMGPYIHIKTTLINWFRAFWMRRQQSKNPRSGRFYIKRKIKRHYNISADEMDM